MKLKQHFYETHDAQPAITKSGQIRFACVPIALCVFFISLQLSAQPSGGPYGPMRQTYTLPKDAGKIFYVAPDGKAGNSGESLEHPTSIEHAFEQVKTGDAIILRGGVYRTGDLILNQGITIQPYANEQPVLKGTYVPTTWKNLGNGLWKISWTHLFPGKPDSWWSRDRYGKETPLYKFNNDMVFADGRFLQAVGSESEVDKNTYYIDYEAGQVYVGNDPAKHLIEITAFDFGIKRTTGECHGKTSDHKGPVIKGIVFTQYANQALDVEGKEPVGVSKESEHGKDVIGTTIENCTITFCSRVAAYLRGDHLTLRHCKVSETSTEGIYIIGSSDVLLEGNIFSHNNIKGITGYYPAAVKIFNQCYHVTCKNNLFIDLPNSNGIWFDVGNVDARFIDNRIERVGDVNRPFRNVWPWPSQNGLFFEISKGLVCAGNVFINCDHGMFILNSSNARIYQNTFVNSLACIARNGRTPANDKLFGWHSSTGPDVDKRRGHVFVNNLLTGDQNYHKPLLFVDQPDSLCKQLPGSQLAECDHNVYVRHEDKDMPPLILWSPATNSNCQLAVQSLADMQAINPDFSIHSQSYSDDIPLFQSSELEHYRVVQAFPGLKYAGPLPAEISKISGLPANPKFVGAYPPTGE